MNLRNLAFTNIAVHQNDGWVCDMFFSGLFHIELDSLRIDFVTLLPSDRELETVQYGPIGYHEEKLYILPQNSDRMLIYNLKDNSFEEIFLSIDRVGENIQLFSDIIFNHGKCFAIPRRSHAILEIDLKSKEVIYHCAYYELIKPYISNPYGFITSDSCMNGEEIFISALQSNHVIRFNVNTKGVQILEIPNMGALGSIGRYNDKYIITERNGMNVCVWDGKKDFENKSYENLNLKSLSGIHKIFRYHNIDYVIPYNANMIMVAEDGKDTADCLCNLAHDYKTGLEYAQIGNQNMQCCEKKGEYIVCYSCFDAKILKINMKTMEIQSIDALINQEALNKIYMAIGSTKNVDILYEMSVCNLNDYMSILAYI